MWEREADFLALLQQVQARASRASIDALAQLAVEDHKLVSKFMRVELCLLHSHGCAEACDTL
jgi:hypothetical protein